MKPQEIEKIAQSVTGAFTQAGDTTVKAGCGGLSDPQMYECVDFGCSANYECGDAGPFNCFGNDFFCTATFDCPSSYSS